MILIRSANETGTLAGDAGPEGISLAAPPAADAAAELEELDDGVEPLIVHMDPTTAEHLFLQAQRQV